MAATHHVIALTACIHALPEFIGHEIEHGRYNHIAATLTDMALQPHLKKYPSQVKPVVNRLLVEYPQCARCDVFVAMMEETSPKYFLNLSDGQRARQIYSLARWFSETGVISENDLANWLRNPENEKELKKQRGVTPRQIDYLRLLMGEETFPIDRPMEFILNRAGLDALPAEEAKMVCLEAAARLDFTPRQFYLNIWFYWLSGKWDAHSA